MVMNLRVMGTEERKEDENDVYVVLMYENLKNVVKF